MLRYILFDTTLFSSGDDPVAARRDLGWVLEALVQRDMNYLREHPETPSLYKSGVVYENPMQALGDTEEVKVLKRALGGAARSREVQRALDTVNAVLGGERFRDVGRVLERGRVDCDNLASWRVAELRQRGGIEASPLLLWRDRLLGGTTYHALVAWPWSVTSRPGDPDDGLIEDPSLLLGMGGPEREADRQNEIRKNQERCEILRCGGSRKTGLVSAVSDPFADLLEGATTISSRVRR